MKKLNLFALLLLAIPAVAFAQSHERTRTEERIFKVSSTALFESDIQFANTIVTLWDRNEISIKIEIKAKACTAAYAEELLDVAKYSFQNSDSRVFVKGEFDSELNKKIERKCGNKRSLEIVYRVILPRNAAMSFKSKFGNIDVFEAKGKLTVNQGFGNFRSSGVIGGEGKYNIEFGNLNLNTVTKNQSVEIKHGNMEIAIAKDCDITINSSFGNSKIGVADVVKGVVKHGNLKLDNVNTFSLSDAQFGNFTIGNLYNKLEITGALSHSNLKVEYVNKNFTSINVPSASFSDIKLNIPQGAFEAELKTSFGNLRIYDDKFDGSVYKTVGGGNPKAKVKISNSHANITITK